MCQVGGGKERRTYNANLSGGVAVMARRSDTAVHFGLVDSELKDAVKARALLDDALALQDAGLAVVIGVPPVGGQRMLEIPTIDWKRTSHVRTSSVSRHARHVCSSSLLHLRPFCKHYANLGGDFASGTVQLQNGNV